MLRIVAGSQFRSAVAESCSLCIMRSVIICSVIIFSRRRVTALLVSVALPTSARGARTPSSGWVVISSTISAGSGLGVGWGWGLGGVGVGVVGAWGGRAARRGGRVGVGGGGGD